MLQAEWRSLSLRLTFLAIAVGCLVTIIGVKPAMAAPCYATETDYYSEPEHINEVGIKFVNCSPPYIQIIGQQTSYFEGFDRGCCGNCPPPPNGPC